MKIEELPEGIKKVIRHPEVDYRTTLKKLDREDLVKSIKVILKETDRKETKIWEGASLILNELTIHKHDVKHPAFVHQMRNKLQKKSKLCFIDPDYHIEAGGIDYKGKIRHPSPDVNPAKKVAKECYDNSVEINSYAKKSANKSTMSELSKHTVTYLKASERDKYLVTFIDQRKIKIGGKTPKDGYYIFALSANGKMLLAAKKINGQFHHSSFFGGRAVQCAGVFDIQKGQLKKVHLASGHYKPDEVNGENLDNFLQLEHNLGAEAESVQILEIAN